MNQNPEQMLAAAAKGEAAAWRGLIEAYSGRVYGLLYRQSGDRELAEEITQDAFVTIFDKLREYREQGRFESWLFKIAVNRLRDEQRRRKRHALSVDFTRTPPETIGYRNEQAPPGSNLEQDERDHQLRLAVSRLPEADRQVIEMRYTAELTFAQIAEILDLPLGTVLARGHRALKKLKTLIPNT